MERRGREREGKRNTGNMLIRAMKTKWQKGG